ncbi:MAG: glycosyltransferase [Candidatus Fimousia sp.]
MKIGIFTDTYYPEINGVANSTYELKKGLESMGHQVYIFTVSNPSVTKDEKNIFRIPSVPFVFLKERRIGCTLAAIWKKKIKRLHLDVIHTQTEFSIGHLGRKTALYLGIPHIHTYHTIYEEYIHYIKMAGNDRVKEMARAFSRHCCNQADAVIVPTKKVKALLRNYGVHQEIHTIATGIPLKKFHQYHKEHTKQLLQLYGLSETQHILLYVGRLSEEKNIDHLIYHFQEIVQEDELARLVIVGDGPEKEKLIDDVKTWQLEKQVIFTGAVDWEEIPDYYAMGDVFVSMSNSETQGLTYFEALASGKPILVQKDDCLQDLLLQKKNGYAFQNHEEFLKGYRFLFGTEFLSSPEEIKASVSKYDEHTFALHVWEVYDAMIRKGCITDEKGSVVGTA